MTLNLLTLAEAGALTRSSKWTVRGWIKRGLLKPTRIGGRVFISQAELDAFIARSNSTETAVLEAA